MLWGTLFILLFLVFIVNAQYHRPPPTRPSRPIPVRPAAQSNIVENEPVTEPTPDTPRQTEKDAREVLSLSTELPEKQAFVSRPVGNRKPPIRSNPTRPPNRPNRPALPGSVSTTQTINVTADHTDSTPEIVIVYPENSRLLKTSNRNTLSSSNVPLTEEYVKQKEFSYPEATSELPTPQSDLSIYELEVEPEPYPESKPDLPVNETGIETQTSPETEAESDVEAVETEHEETTYELEEEPRLRIETEPEGPTYESEIEPQPIPEAELESPSRELELDPHFLPEAELQTESHSFAPELEPIPEQEPITEQESPVQEIPDSTIAFPNTEVLDVTEVTTSYPIVIESEREPEIEPEIKPKPELPELKPVTPQHPIPGLSPTLRPTRPSTPSYGRPRPDHSPPPPPSSSRPTIAPSKPYIPPKHPIDATQSKPIVDFACEEPNGYYSFARECDTYVECRKSVAWKHICPDGLLYNPDIYWPQYPCDYPSQVRCGNKTVIQKPKPTGECPRQFGTFPSNTDDCGKYIVCHDGRPNLMTCPSGLAFNPRSGGCDWPENVPTCNPNVFQGFTCPAPPKDQYGRISELIYTYRFRNSCKEYIACLKGEPRLLRCDAGLSFDQVSGRCINSDAVINCEA